MRHTAIEIHKRATKFGYIAIVLMIGCAAIGLTPANKFDEKLAYAIGLHTAVQKSAAQSLDAHAITSAEAKEVLKMADESRVILDGAAAAAGAGDMTTANAKLLLATGALTALRTYLNDRSKHG